MTTGDISRLKDAEITDGNFIVADDIDAELNQLVNNDNAINLRVYNLENSNMTIAGVKTFSSSPTFALNLNVTGNAVITGNNTVTGNIVGNTINERTAASGVTIDSVLCKDAYIKVGSAGYTPIANGEVGYDSTAHTYKGYQNSQAIRLDPARVLLDTQTASSSATINFTSFTNSNIYSQYEIEALDVIPATNNVSFHMRVSTDNGSTYPSTNEYSWTSLKKESGTAGAQDFSATATAQIVIVDELSSTTTNALNASILTGNLASTSVYKGFKFNSGNIDNGNDITTSSGTGFYLSATAVTALRFLMSSGNIASGTFRLYGIRK